MPKQVNNVLTAMQVKNQKTPGRIADGCGLYLDVSETGVKYWVWRGTVQGVRRDRGIGSVQLYSLSEARDIARQWIRIARDGGDPAVERDNAKRANLTFEDAARQVWADQIQNNGKSAQHQQEWIRSLEKFVFAKIGSRPVAWLNEGDMLKVLGPVWLDKPETARRVRQRLRAVFDWARAAGHCSGINPVEGIEKALPKQRDKPVHLAALPYAELPALMGRIDAVGGIGALALQFLILTAARSGEVRGARWAEIDLDARVWVVPASRMKAGIEHRVPLSAAALAVLEQVRGFSNDLVFPSRQSGKKLSDTTISWVLKSLAVPVTVHGFRSTFRDWSEEMASFSHEAKEAALAHVVKNQVERAYRRGDLLDQRRPLMDQWSRYCTSASTSADVVELRR